MPGSISEFKSSFKTDVARPNKFDVQIPIPLGLTPFLGTSKQLSMRCENADLPGRSFATYEQKYYGPTEKFPYAAAYHDTVMTFIISDNMQEKLFFDAWFSWINPNYHFNFKYKGDYAVPIRVNQYDVTNTISYSVDLIDAYPTAMNQMDLDWSSDGHHRLVVAFTYKFWRNNSVESLGMDLLESGIDAGIDRIFERGLNGSGVTTGIGYGLGTAAGAISKTIGSLGK